MTTSSSKKKWWLERDDPAYPVQAKLEAQKMGADSTGRVKYVGLPIQTEWSGSYREMIKEDAAPKPNTISTLHYTTSQTPDAYIMSVSTSWPPCEKTTFDLEEVTVKDYRPVAYVYITGPPGIGKKMRKQQEPLYDFLVGPSPIIYSTREENHRVT